ncbi:hypothetical protein cand_026320 [Cryptosporidium andersoni]|uniref:14-3-3 domain-containing protein n=1 Tax=Cryptosporidium andersoni TaxID=117008 RepID=A0A1J4MAG1_9CRYT|nr:hypothetical protein cand_026320 [Cryptosporidium andersoni]
MTISKAAYKAKLSDSIGNYEDVIQILTESSDFHDSSLRLLLVGSLRNRITSLRTSSKTIKSCKEKLDPLDLSKGLISVINEICEELSKLIMDESEDVIRLIDDNILMYCNDHDKAFCNKLKGDLMRYRAEITTGSERSSNIKASVAFYEDSLQLARGCTEKYPIDPLYLGTILNYSILKCNLLDNPEGAIIFINRALLAVKESNDTLSPQSEQLIKILNDNISKWEQGSKNLFTSALF